MQVQMLPRFERIYRYRYGYKDKARIERGREWGEKNRNRRTANQSNLSQKGCHMCQMTFACGNDNDFCAMETITKCKQTKGRDNTHQHTHTHTHTDTLRDTNRTCGNFIESCDICICLPYL